jgi:hypothetical protein
MATKKTDKPVNEEVLEAEETAQEEPVKDVWEQEVEMVVPRKPRGDDHQYYVCVNDRRYLIPADGRVQKLPRPVAEVLKESLEAEAEAEEYADRIPNRSGDMPQQHAIG